MRGVMVPPLDGFPFMPSLGKKASLNLDNTFPAPGNPLIDMWFGKSMYFGKQLSDLTFSRGQNGATNITPDLTPSTLPTFISYAAQAKRIIPGIGNGFLVEGSSLQFYAGSSIAPAGSTTTANLSAGTYSAWCIADAGAVVAVTAGTPGNVTGLNNISQGVPSNFTVSSTGTTITVDLTATVGTVYYLNVEQSANTVPTSIINVAAGGTRGIDNIAFTVFSPFVSSGVGTYVTVCRPLTPNTLNAVEQHLGLSENQTDTNNRLAMFRRFTAGQKIARCVLGNVAPDMGNDVWNFSQRGKLAFVNSNGFQLECFNGGFITTGTTAAPSNMSIANLGRLTTSALSGHWYGFIERVIFWPDIKPASFIQAITQ